MSDPARRIEAWLRDNAVESELLRFASSVHTVDQAVAESGIPIQHFTKSIAMVDDSGRAIVAVVPASSRASTERVRKALELAVRPRLATASESEAMLGQRLGGNCPFDVGDATVLVDPQVLAQNWVVLGGGDDRSLVRISTAELRRVVELTEVRVRK